MKHDPGYDWDSVARRYVERDTLPESTFGALPATHVAAGCTVDTGGNIRKLPANDNVPVAPQQARHWLDDAYDMGEPKVQPARKGDELPKRDWNAGLPRRGDWMQTFSGFQFWPLDPRANEIHIVDIAHALSMQCRYAGHCLRFYSVAEHSVHLARYVSPKNAMWALLHDASEAYLVDVPRPVKPDLTNYKQIEAKVMAEVCKRFGLSPEMPAEIHEADGAIIGDERANMAPCVAPWYSTGGPLGIRLAYWTPEQAESAFLATFERLQNMRDAA